MEQSLDIRKRNMGLNEIPERYHHFFLEVYGLSYVEMRTHNPDTNKPELRFTLHYYNKNRLCAWYGDGRIKTMDACSAINPSCHIEQELKISLREQRINICRTGKVEN